jgi:hypothetical protein
MKVNYREQIRVLHLKVLQYQFGINLKQFENIDNIVKLFAYPAISNIIYQEFIEMYKSEFAKLIKSIFQQIYKLKLLLRNMGLKYTDNKLDNFAFVFGERPREHWV